MNDRIRELAKQVGIKITPDEEYEYEEVNMDGYDDLKAFAELIVRECAEFVRYKAEKAMSQEILYVGDDLLTHFGVE